MEQAEWKILPQTVSLFCQDKIEIVDGNVLDSKATLIVHQVNCIGKMGAGVAKSVAETYPHVEREYRKYLNHCNKKGINPLGTVQCVPVHVWALPMINTMDNRSACVYDDNDCQYIVNLFGQQDIGSGLQTDLNAFEKALNRIKRLALELRCDVAMPYKIASCRGGADWDDVYSIIKRVFLDSTVNVEIWKLDIG